MPLQKLSEIEEKLQKDYIDIKKRYIKLKRCKYALLILKTSLLSLSIGLSFLNSHIIIIVSSIVPIIDSIMLITNKDKEVSHLKLQKDIINQIIKEIDIKRYTFEDDEEVKKIYFGSVRKNRNLFRYMKYIMKFINFDNIINKNMMKIIILIKIFLYLNMFQIQLLLVKQAAVKQILLFNILTLNPVFQKVFIFTKEPEAKYNFLIKNFLKDIKIFIKMMNMILIN